MKNYRIPLITTTFLLVALIASASNVFPSSVGPNLADIDSELIYDNEFVSYSISKTSLAANVSLANYDSNKQYFSLKTFKKISFLQVYTKAGELEYQLPINDDLIHLSLLQFEEGSYNINILFEDEKDFLSTKLTKK